MLLEDDWLLEDQVDGDEEYVLGDELRLDRVELMVELKVELMVEPRVDVLLCVDELSVEPKQKWD